MSVGWSIKRIVDEGKTDVSATDLITDLWDALDKIEKVATQKACTSVKQDAVVWTSIKSGVIEFKTEVETFHHK